MPIVLGFGRISKVLLVISVVLSVYDILCLKDGCAGEFDNVSLNPAFSGLCITPFSAKRLLAGLDAFVAGLTEFEILQFNPSEVRRIDKRIQPQACQ